MSGVWLERGGGVGLRACSPQELTGPWWAEWSVWRREREGPEWVIWQPSPGWPGMPMA